MTRAATERERGHLASVEALYGAGTKVERDASFNRALGELARKFPEDLDARSFHALSWLGLSGSTRDTANYMRAAAEAEAVYELDPRHPGALHYLVHAYDDPVHAPLGLRAARRYGKVAPAAAHAQHMPSHIFFALGMWDDAIEANIASLATARSQGQGGYHALEWLAYAYLQQGMREDAAKLVQSVADDVARKPTQGNRTTLAYARAMWLVETGSADPTGWADVDETGIKSIYAFSAYDFARGVVAARSGDVAAAEAQARRLQARSDAARANAVGVVASRYDSVTPVELEQGQILATALAGAILFAGRRPRPRAGGDRQSRLDGIRIRPAVLGETPGRIAGRPPAHCRKAGGSRRGLPENVGRAPEPQDGRCGSHHGTRPKITRRLT